MTVNAALFRKALGSFASGVTVITNLYKGEKAGVTISSFSSVSLEPPLVLFSLADTSRLMGAFNKSSHFNIHILSEGQKDLAQAFANKTTRNWDAFAHKQDKNGVPVLKDAVAILSCSVSRKIKAGDHHIILGSVLDIEAHDFAPLLYFRRHYHNIGKVRE